MTLDSKYGRGARTALFVAATVLLMDMGSYIFSPESKRPFNQFIHERRIGRELEKNLNLGETGSFVFESNGIKYEAGLSGPGVFISEKNRNDVYYMEERGLLKPDSSLTIKLVSVHSDYFGNTTKEGLFIEERLGGTNWTLMDSIACPYLKHCLEHELERSLPSKSDTSAGVIVNTYYLYLPKEVNGEIIKSDYIVLAEKLVGADKFRGVILADYVPEVECADGRPTDEQKDELQRQVLFSGILEALTAYNDSVSDAVEQQKKQENSETFQRQKMQLKKIFNGDWF